MQLTCSVVGEMFLLRNTRSVTEPVEVLQIRASGEYKALIFAVLIELGSFLGGMELLLHARIESAQR